MRSTSSNSHDEFVNDMLSSTLGTDAHTTSLVKYSLMAIGIVAILKIISQSLLYYSLLASPLLYGYLKTTCPTVETFDAKEQLKTVLGGDHLPEAHPDKPKSKWQQFFNSAKANVTAEYSALVDMQVEFIDVIGCGILAKVTAQQRTHYWVGASHQWRYVGSTPDPAAAQTAAAQTAGEQSSSQRRSSTSAATASATSTATTSAAAASLLSSLTGSMSKKTS